MSYHILFGSIENSHFILKLYVYTFYLFNNFCREEKNVAVEKLSNSEILIQPKFASCVAREDMIQNADKIKNIYEMFEYSVKKYSSKKCLGVRPLLGESKTNVNGKVEEKLKLGNEYVWNTFKEVEERVINISNGLSLKTTLEDMVQVTNAR